MVGDRELGGGSSDIPSTCANPDLTELLPNAGGDPHHADVSGYTPWALVVSRIVYDYDERLADDLIIDRKLESDALEIISMLLRFGVRLDKANGFPDNVASPLQQNELMKWILDEKGGGRTPYDFEIRQMAEFINQANRGVHSFRKHWVKRFINRHPTLQKKLQKSLEASHASFDLPNKIRNIQQRFKVIVRELKIKDENIVNMDEISVQEGETRKRRVAASENGRNK
ncbi:hypothetical protein DL766_007248 [Monosporascus sp. MC13-8B]|uniref:HTH CENPB-type domain-containing protein n=1 Tax=Monosporascus cannonballus TaxID=155416 RepID=A0ABY0H9C6_9PEZI|nr:hypothetical protein DL762_004956 [Monosporascus cannonballus]RYO90805.1 hypothetical protein DL763_005202 [Monosporascus cannonballus]RYP24642.1 hypothetical protein DL766_007248 [Monosporascus sp. MC13-8B]